MSETAIQGGAANTAIKPPSVGPAALKQLLSAMPVTERQLDLAGITTAVLEGGKGQPVVLLHGPGEYAAKWVRVVPTLARTCRVIVPDLPGHGKTVVPGGRLDADRVLEWLGALIEETCDVPPALVGQILGGAIAARFAVGHGAKLDKLVLVDTLGLSPFKPAPEFGQALDEFLAAPNEETHDGLWHRCAFDLDRLRDRMGKNWDSIRSYNLDRARETALHPTQQSLMEQFGMPAIPEAELSRIVVQTMLIWGRHDLATSLSVAQAASERFGWLLHVIEDAADDPPIEQPEAFVRVLQLALGQGNAVHGGEGR